MSIKEKDIDYFLRENEKLSQMLVDCIYTLEKSLPFLQIPLKRSAEDVIKRYYNKDK